MMAILGRNMYPNICQINQICAFVGIISIELCEICFIHDDINNYRRHGDIAMKKKVILCNRCLFAINNHHNIFYAVCTILFNHFNYSTICIFNYTVAHIWLM